MNKSFNFSEINSQETTVGLCGSFMFSFFSLNCQTVFQSGFITFYPHQQNLSDPVSSHPYQHLVLSLFFHFNYSDGCVV